MPRIAVVGCGVWGSNHLRIFEQLKCLAGVVDDDKERAQVAADKYQVPVWNFGDVVADPSIDGLVIATPPSTHAELATRALNAGKHVLVEKPMALNLEDAKRLTDLSKQTPSHLVVGHVLSYHPAFIRLKQLCDDGDLGDIRYLYSNRLHLGRFRQDEDSLWSFAPHDVSMILSILGSDVTRVMAFGNSYISQGINDVTTTHIDFQSGSTAQIFVSWLHPFKEQRLIVVGEHGMAVFEDTLSWPDKLRIYEHKVNWVDGVPFPTKADYKVIEVEPAEPLVEECKHFLDCIRGDAVPQTNAVEALRVLRILGAATQSIVDGKAVIFNEAI